MRSFFMVSSMVCGISGISAQETAPVLADVNRADLEVKDFSSPILEMDLRFESQVEPDLEPDRSDIGILSDQLLSRGLKRVDWLERSGALGLAESVLVEQRPGVDDAEPWMQWERRLWQNLRNRGLWEQLANRANQIPSTLPRSFQLEARTIGIEALMQQRRFREARASLRLVLFEVEMTPQSRSNLRRKIFLSYLWDDNFSDADTAMRRYQQEYFPDDRAWNLMRARVLLKTGQPETAVSQLASASNVEARILRLYGRLLSGTMKPDEVIGKALAIKEKRLKPEQILERWVLIAEAAGRAGELPRRVEALEQALSISTDSSRVFIKVQDQDLVDAYLDLARASGNDAHLLIGDFGGWLDYADSLSHDSPIGSRAVYTYIGHSADEPSLISEAYGRLASSLRKSDLNSLIFRLFGDSRPLGGYELMGNAVGLSLSEDALKQGDIKLAAALSAPITQPPSGVSHLDWQLRQARMSIYAGNVGNGISILAGLLDILNTASEAETDRVLQILFDLQTLGRHEDALPLFTQIYKLASTKQQKREILFWLAESLEASDMPEDAALLFLRSATMAAGEGLWLETARYRAAVALQKAGLIEDARVLYQKLLATTRDPKRREQLTRKLQDLWLLESKRKNSQASDS